MHSAMHLWAPNWQISGQKSIAVVDVLQKLSSTLASIQRCTCGHKIGRFLARRASLWLMLFSKFNFGKHSAMHLWAPNWQISGQKSIAVVDVLQKLSSTLVCIQQCTCGQQIGRFLARRASLWSMLFFRN